jgi:hypothetical protein
MRRTILPLILLLTSTISIAESNNDRFENAYNYLESGIGTVKIDGVGNGLYLSLGGSGTFGNFIINGQFSLDIDSSSTPKVSRLGFGYLWRLNNQAEIIIGYNVSKIDLTLDSGGSGTVDEDVINLGFSSYLSDNSSATVSLSVPVTGGGSVGFGFAGNYWLNDSTAIHFGYEPNTGGSSTNLTLRFSL